MTDNEIIKALKCCSGYSCSNCPFDDGKITMRECVTELSQNALDLINRQQAEIERLREENKSIRYCYEQAKQYNNRLAESCETNCPKFNMTTRAETLKEFAERLKEHTHDIVFYGEIVTISRIDNLVKEMTEVKEDE